MSRVPWLMAAAALLLAGGGVAAQEPGAQDLAALLNQKVTTASRFSERIADAPAAVTVITAEDIQRMGALELGDVLRMVPGLNLDLHTRGDYVVTARNAVSPISPGVLVILDGRQTMETYYNTTNWQTLIVALDQIERIEVVRGPGSTLYGANAYDAVINIVTRKPTGGTQLDAHTAGGADGDRHAQGVLRQTAGPFRFEVMAGGDATHTPETMANAPGYPPIHELYDMRIARTRVGFSTVGGSDLEATFGGSGGDIFATWIAGSTYLPMKYSQRFAQLDFNQPHVLGEATLHARAYAERATHGDYPSMNPNFREAVQVGEVTLDRVFGTAHHLLTGLQGKRAWNSDFYPSFDVPHEQMLFGGFLQDSWTMSSHVRLIGGVRYDKEPHRNGALSPRAALLVQPSPAHTLRFSAGRAFRMPTLVEQNSNMSLDMGGGFMYHWDGNPMLKPAQITSFEAGYIGSIRRDLALTVDLFHNDHAQATSTVPTQFGVFNGAPFPSRVQYQNVDAGDARGGEIGLRFEPNPNVKGQVNYAYLVLHDTLGHASPGAPKHKVNAEFGVRALKPIWIDATYHYVDASDLSPQYAGGFYGPGPFTIAARSSVDLNLRAELPRGVALSVFTQDLLNHRYRDIMFGEYFTRRVVGQVGVAF